MDRTQQLKHVLGQLNSDRVTLRIVEREQRRNTTGFACESRRREIRELSARIAAYTETLRIEAPEMLESIR